MTTITDILQKYPSESPILSEIKDPYELRMAFNRYGVVPRFGNSEVSSDAILGLLYQMAGNNPFMSACVNGITNFMTGGGLELKNKSIFNRKSEEIKDSEIIEIEGVLLDRLIDTDIFDLLQVATKGYIVDGNIGLLVTVNPKLKVFKIVFVSPLRWRLNVDKTAAIIANDFTYKFPTTAKQVPCYPNMLKTEDNNLVFFYHIKQNTPNREYYGDSSGSSALLSAYLWQQYIMYQSKGVGNAFTPDFIFDIPLDAGSNDENIKQLNKLFVSFVNEKYTRRGEHQMFVPFFNQSGISENGQHRPLTITPIPKNDDSNYYETWGAITREAIFAAFNWSAVLAGVRHGGGLANELTPSLKLASMSLTGDQRKIGDGFTSLVQICYELMGDGFDKKIELVNLYQKTEKQEKEDGNTNNS